MRATRGSRRLAYGGMMFQTPTRLRAIKVLHTAVWAVFAGAIVALPVVAWRGVFHVAFAQELR